jgi:Sensors of blue-light using FAD
VADASDPAEQGRELWCLVYVSAAASDFETSDLEEILRVARVRNAADEITGMLLFEGASFLQVLEGPPAQIDALLEDIRKDRRHSRTALLVREAIAQRSFADWTMGYTQVALGELADATGLNDFFADRDSFCDLTSDKVNTLLSLFRAGSYRQRLL